MLLQNLHLVRALLPSVTRVLPLEAAASGSKLQEPQTQHCQCQQQQQRRWSLSTGQQQGLLWQHVAGQQQQLRHQHTTPDQRTDGQHQKPHDKQGQQAEQQQAKQRDPQEQGAQQQHDHQQQEGQQQQAEQQGASDGIVLEGPKGLLLEWRTESSRWWSMSMFYMIVDSTLNYPQYSTWSVLYQPQAPGFWRRLLVPEGGSTLTWGLQRMYSRQQRVAEFLLSQAHEDFDPDSFRDGVKQALEYSTSLYEASDWVTLKPLVATALLQSMQRARELQAGLMQEHDVSVSGIELVIDPESVRVVSASSLTREQLNSLDEQRARDSLPLLPVGADDEESCTVDAVASAAAAAATAAAAAPVAEGAADQIAWDLAHVYAEGVLHTQVSSGNGPARVVRLPKRGHYLLCRGPVHVDRVLSAKAAETTPWFLLSWL